MHKIRLDSHPHIRCATEADLGRILEIERLSFDPPWSEHQFRTSLKELFFVYEQEEILGFLISCICEIAKRAIILRIAVHPDHRGKGLASELILAALDQFKDLNLRCAELDVEVVKNGVIKLYEKFGFKIMKVATVNYDEDTSFFIMKLVLRNSEA
jgi:ribosomal-protein-alanine N-acetyltransferase